MIFFEVGIVKQCKGDNMAIPQNRRNGSNQSQEPVKVAQEKPVAEKPYFSEEQDSVGLFVEKKNNKKLYAIIAGIIALLALIGGALWLFVFSGNDEEVAPVEEETSQVAQPEEDEPRSNEVVGTENKEFWLEEGEAHPVDTEEWQRVSRNEVLTSEYEEIDGEVSDYISSYYMMMPGLSSIGQALPSKSSGYTDDISQATTEDGLPNLQYAYWTEETFNYFVGDYIERLINPIYGNWSMYQESGMRAFLNEPNYLKGEFKDVYQTEYYNSVVNKPAVEWLPVFADWNGDDYGLADQLLPEANARWMGEANYVNVKFNYNEETSEYESANVTVDVTYSAWTQDQDVLEKNGVITFDVVKGVGEERYMITNSKLEMK